MKLIIDFNQRRMELISYKDLALSLFTLNKLLQSNIQNKHINIGSNAIVLFW